MSRTKDFQVIQAAGFQTQLDTVAADLYGGVNDVTLGAGNLKGFSEAGQLNFSDGTNVSVDDAVNGTQDPNGQEITGTMPTYDGTHSIYESGTTDLTVHAMGWEDLAGPKEEDSKYVHLIPFNNLGKDQRAYTTAESALVSSGYLATDRINLAMHFARLTGVSEEHLKNGYCNSFEFSSSAGNPLQLKLSGVGESLTRDTGKSTYANWTKQANSFSKRFMHYEGAFTLGTLGGSLTSRGILEFTVSANQGMATDNQPTGTSNGGLNRAEPLSTGMSEVNVTFRIYKHETDDYKTWEAGQTVLSAKMAYTRGGNYCNFFFPELQVVSAEPDFGNGGSVLVTCKAKLPTGTDPFSTDRTVDSVLWALPFRSAFYMMIKDNVNTNWMRAV